MRKGRKPTFFSDAVRDARRFFLDLAPPPDREVSVVCGGYEVGEKDYAIDRETFPYYSIELVARGRGKLTLGADRFDLSPGALFTYGPGVPHTIRTNPRSRLGKYFVDFAGMGAGELFRQLGLPPGGFARIDALPEVQLVFNELIRDGARGDDTSAELCVALLRLLVLRIAANRIDDSAEGAEPYVTYRRCVAYIDQHAGRLTSQQQAAEECGVSPAYLSRLFKRHGRQTAYQYLTRLRMNLAAERLNDSSDPVKEIAEELGYTDPFHFSRTFKATFGVSPRAFRSLR